MTKSVDAAIKQAILYSDDFNYYFVQLPPNGIVAAASLAAEAREPFIGLVVDKDEVTLMITDEDYEEYKKRLRDHTVSDNRYRLITFDIELDLSMFGFMAKISQTLADAGISMLAFTAYSRDHIFVTEDDFDNAMQVLHELQDEIDA